MSQLANQIAVVTGAGRGIGRAIALKFAAEGADVVCVSRTPENSEKVANEIGALGRKAWAFAVDVTDSAAVNAAAVKILADCGKVDILVNNAGVTRDGLLMRMSDEDWDTVLNTNLKGAFFFTKAFSRAFARQRSGRIINISSVIGLIGNAGQCNYAASKAGLIGFTQSVARELASRRSDKPNPLYYAQRTEMPSRVRAFIDFVMAQTGSAAACPVPRVTTRCVPNHAPSNCPKPITIPAAT